MEAYPNDPIENFAFENIDIEGLTAGTISDAVNWVFANTHIAARDGSRVTLKDCRNVKGLP